MPIESRSIPVIVDKSHLVTIGEKLYTEKTSFIRELVNNAYDADAEEVRVTISPDRICIQDNGGGMDEDGLRQYFTIGSPYKKMERESPRFHRTRIGEFGIGKFAALAASKTFELETQRGDFRARLIFDKDEWSRHEDWHLNIDILPPNPEQGNGTAVTLHDPDIQFAPGMVKRYLSERTPIHADHFAVFVNEERVSDDIVVGRVLTVSISLPYGRIEGKIVISPADRRTRQNGIAVTVKGVLVRYEQFGLDKSKKYGAGRITGKINADFLPITSGRDDFQRDSEPFIAFQTAVKKELEKALAVVKREGDRKADIQASRILKDALQKIGRAMQSHKDLFPKTQVPLGMQGRPMTEPSEDAEEPFKVSEPKFAKSAADMVERVRISKQAEVKKKSARKKTAALGTKSVTRSLKIAEMDVAVRMEHLGAEENESLLSGGIIFVNLDHALYRTYRNNDDLLTIHVARVVTKELALKSGITDARRAFEIQADLLTDALKAKGV